MRWVVLVLVILLAFLLFGCSSSKSQSIKGKVNEEMSGISIGPAEQDENGEIVHNIYNFDDVKRKVRVTTICLDALDEVVDDSDSYVMELEPDSVTGWKPQCPDQFVEDYRINVSELEE